MPRFIDMTGMRYGKLIAIKRMKANKFRVVMWECQCDCGNTKIIAGISLRQGSTKSCGCIVSPDLTGQRFGRLVAVERISGSGKTRVKWLCRCDCGNMKIVGTSHLKSGGIRSCGCIRNLPPGEAAFRALLRSYKQSAKERKHTWNISENAIRKLFVQPCYYCGAKPSQTSFIKGMNGKFTYNGVDRIDPNGDYSLQNLVPCCGHCNYAKGRKTLEEFKTWVIKVYTHLDLS